jgi:hypothetical protein
MQRTRPAYHLIGAVSQNPFGRIIVNQDVAFKIGYHDTVCRTLDDVAEKTVGAQQLPFHLNTHFAPHSRLNQLLSSLDVDEIGKFMIYFEFLSNNSLSDKHTLSVFQLDISSARQ